MSDVTRRRIAALLLVGLIAVVALALADVGPFEDPPTVEEEVAAATEEFFATAASGEGKAFCRLLTDDARSSLETQVGTLLGEDDPPPCDEAFRIVHAALKESELTIRRVSVSGNQARVDARLRLGGGRFEPRTVELIEQQGEWRVSDPG